MYLVSYEHKYKSKVMDLLGESGYELLWGDKSIHNILAINDNNIIGIGALWRNKVHPYREYVGIYVSEHKRNQGVGYAIYKELLTISQTKQFQAAVSSKNNFAMAFLKKCRFKIARRCFTPTLIQLRKESAEEQLMDCNVISLSDSPANLKAQLVHIQYENYKLFHSAVNPLNSDISIDEWEKMILDEIDEKHSFLFIKNNELEAYIICYSEGSNEISIGYVGGKCVEKVTEYIPFYKITILKLIHQFEIVTIEADDIDTFAFAALNEFFYNSTESWDTYVLNESK